jgi:nitroreductase
MEVYEAIRGNRSVRQFSDEAVSRANIERIVNAGRLSGSAKNVQPWTFVVVTERATLKALSQCWMTCASPRRSPRHSTSAAPART